MSKEQVYELTRALHGVEHFVEGGWNAVFIALIVALFLQSLPRRVREELLLALGSFN